MNWKTKIAAGAMILYAGTVMAQDCNVGGPL
jgi:hypothetical protein